METRNNGVRGGGRKPHTHAPRMDKKTNYGLVGQTRGQTGGRTLKGRHSERRAFSVPNLRLFSDGLLVGAGCAPSRFISQPTALHLRGTAWVWPQASIDTKDVPIPDLAASPEFEPHDSSLQQGDGRGGSPVHTNRYDNSNRTSVTTLQENGERSKFMA